jgi:hypothetical protein
MRIYKQFGNRALAKANGKTVLVDTDTNQIIKVLGVACAAAAVTDREFLRGHGMLGNEFDGDDTFDEVLKRAKARGYTPNANDVYMPALADDPGDPLAFVPASGGRGHVKKVCEKRNWKCDGMVKTEMELDLPSHQIPYLAKGDTDAIPIGSGSTDKRTSGPDGG